MTTLLQGAIIGGAASWLSGNIEQLANQRSPHTWGQVALVANHLFLSVGAVLQQSGGTGVLFSFAAQTVLVLTPFVMLQGFGWAPLLNDTHVRLGAHFCFATTAVCGVALIALGNLPGGAAILAMLAWEKSKRGEGTLLHRSLNGGCALIAGIGYAGWILSKGEVVARAALSATFLLGLASTLYRGPREEGEPPPYTPPPEDNSVYVVRDLPQPSAPPAEAFIPPPSLVISVPSRDSSFEIQASVNLRPQRHVGRGRGGAYRGGSSGRGRAQPLETPSPVAVARARGGSGWSMLSPPFSFN